MDKVMATLPWAPIWISILFAVIGSLIGYYFFKRSFYSLGKLEYREAFIGPVSLKTIIPISIFLGAVIGFIIIFYRLSLTYRFLFILVPLNFYLGFFIPMIAKKMRERMMIIRNKELVEIMHDVPETKVQLEDSIENINQLIQREKFLRAKFELMKLTKRDIREIGKLIRIANFYFDLGQIEEGMKFLLSKKKDFENEYLYYRHLALFCLESGKEDDALTYAKETERIVSNSNSALLLGYIYWTLHDLNKAIDFTQKSLALNPEGELLVAAKNNLAYYYAQAYMPEKKDLALEYANFDKDNWHKYKGSNNYSINSAYVQMRFADSLDELHKAIKVLRDSSTLPDLKVEAQEYLKEAYEKETKMMKGIYERGSGLGIK